MAALEGNWREELLLTLRQARETYAHYQRLIGECDQQINALIRAFERDLAGPQEPGSDVEAGSAKPSSRRAGSLRTQLKALLGTDLMLIPGVAEKTALVLFAEIGPDLSRFPSSAHFASWLGLCPNNKIGGDKILSSKIGPGDQRAAQALRWATQSLY